MSFSTGSGIREPIPAIVDDRSWLPNDVNSGMSRIDWLGSNGTDAIHCKLENDATPAYGTD